MKMNKNTVPDSVINGQAEILAREACPEGAAQLSLNFHHRIVTRQPNPREQRLRRACRWFNRMRQVVERATGWNPAPPPRPEQIWLPNATNLH